MARRLLILVVAFAFGMGLALLLGADNTGIALGVGQLAFAAALVAVLLQR
jgi:hypothetical protein